MATTNTWVGGGDVRVTGQGTQVTPAAAALAGGGTIVVWIDTSTGTGQVHGQLLDANGNKFGSELVLSTSPAGGVPAVAGTADGGFVVTWDSRSDVLAPTLYLSQHFNGAGQALGAAVQANALPNFDPSTSSDITGLTGGGYVVEWWQNPGGPTFWGPSIQVYGANGAPVGGNQPIGYEADGTPVGTATYIHAADTVAMPDGGFIEVWSAEDPAQPGGATTDHVFYERFNASGGVLFGPTEVATDPSSVLTVSDVAAAVLSGSGTVVVATTGVLPDGRSEIVAQPYNASGVPLPGAQAIVTNNAIIESKITALSDGSFVVTWLDSSVTGDLKQQQTVWTQHFDGSGARLGGQILVGTSQAGATHFSVTPTPDGGAIFAWDDTRADAGDVFAQKFATNPAGDVVPPTVISFSPPDEATKVGVNVNVTVTFTEAIQRGAGAIVLHDGAGNVIASYDAASPNVTISGATLNIHPANPLTPGTAYGVDFAPGSVTDLAGNPYAGTTTYNFTTDTSAPPPAPPPPPPPPPPPAPPPAPAPDGHYVLDSSSGVPTAVFAGVHNSYTMTPTAGGVVVNGPLGSDTVAVSRVQFSDLAFAFDVSGSAGEAYRLYQAAFDRTPDQPGLGFWIKDLDHGQPLAAVSDFFVNSPEFQAKYGPLDVSGFVVQLYANVLHRAPDAAGEAYWVGHLNHNDLTRADTLMYFSESPENQANVIGTIQNGMPYVPFAG